MNTLFIDVYKFSTIRKTTKKSIITLKDVFFKFKIFKSNIENVWILLLDVSFLECFSCQKNLLERYIAKVFLKKIKKIFCCVFDNLNIVLPTFFSKLRYKDSVIDVLKKMCPLAKEVTISSSVPLNDYIYITAFAKKSSIDLEKLRISLILNNIDGIEIEKIMQYIYKYKFFDICMWNTSSTCKVKIQKYVETLNDEYGTSIDIISKENLHFYDVCISFLDISIDDIRSDVIVKKDNMLLEMYDIDSDVYSDEIKYFNCNEEKIENFFNINGLKLDDYYKKVLGYVFMNTNLDNRYIIT